jgi:hypothetical protein
MSTTPLYVYRIQNAKGNGVYNPHKTSKRKVNNSPYFTNEFLEIIDAIARESLSKGFRFPPQRSRKISKKELANFRQGQFMSGFASIKQLVAWFPVQEELNILKKYGFDIYKVEASKIIKLENQVIFIPNCEVGECSRKITKNDLSKLSKKELSDISKVIKDGKKKLRNNLKNYKDYIPPRIKKKISDLIKE